MLGHHSKTLNMTKYALAALAAVLFAGGAHAAEPAPAGYLSLDDYTVQVAAASPQKTEDAQVFEAIRGASLRATLDAWAQAAAWQPIVWQLPADSDFTLGAGGRFDGDFLLATKSLVNALGPEANLRVRFHHANRVLVVEALQ